MAVLEIVTGAENPILRAVSADVVDFNDELAAFIEDLKDTMAAAKGLGIAAPQVGKNVRVFIVTLGFKEENQQILAMINPVIVSRSATTNIDEEGCLSLPGLYGNVERFSEIEVEFFDAKGGRHSLKLQGLDARVVQHENDHIDGILFIDRMKEMNEKKALAL